MTSAFCGCTGNQIFCETAVSLYWNWRSLWKFILGFLFCIIFLLSASCCSFFLLQCLHLTYSSAFFFFFGGGGEGVKSLKWMEDWGVEYANQTVLADFLEIQVFIWGVRLVNIHHSHLQCTEKQVMVRLWVLHQVLRLSTAQYLLWYFHSPTTFRHGVVTAGCILTMERLTLGFQKQWCMFSNVCFDILFSFVFCLLVCLLAGKIFLSRFVFCLFLETINSYCILLPIR